MTTDQTTGKRLACRKGMTLIEATISVLIVGTMISVVLYTFGSLARGRQIRTSRHIGASLARQLLSEVIQCSYEDTDGSPVFGPEASEGVSSRANWDDVDDYHEWSASPPQAKDGTDASELTGWTRSVSVVYVDADDLTPVGQDDGVKQITVTVTSPNDAEIELVALRCSNGAYDRQYVPEDTYVTWVGVELQVGSDSQVRLASGTNILNLASSTE